MALLALLVVCTHSFNAKPSIVNRHHHQSTSATGLFRQPSILETPLKAPKRLNNKKKTKFAKYSFKKVKALNVGSLILLLHDPQVRHKVRRRPLLISVDKEERQCKAMRAFQEGQELARLAVQEVLSEHNIHDVSV